MQNHKNVSEATYIKISERKRNEKNRAKRTQRIVSSVVVLLCFAFLIMGGINLVSATSNAYVLNVDGEEIATLVSADEAEAALAQCLEAQKKQYLDSYDYEVTYTNDVTITEIPAVGTMYSSVSEAADILAESLHMVAKAVVITIDGKEQLYVANQNAALAAVSQAKNHYGNPNTYEDITAVYTAEKIETRPVTIECDDVLTVEEAANMMVFGQTEPTDNPQPLISVNVERVVEEIMDLPYEVVMIDDNEMMRGNREVVTAGQNGTQEATLKQVLVNGVLASSEQIDSEVITAAVDEVIKVGVKFEVLSRGANGSGSFGWPLSSDDKGEITSRFGWRSRGWHSGVDIANPTGTIVYAAESGTVIQAGDRSDGYGNLVVIDHGDGVQTYYAHNSDIYVSEGDFVERGNSIAAIGMTGNTTGPHVHFEIRIDDTAVDPLDYIE